MPHLGRRWLLPCGLVASIASQSPTLDVRERPSLQATPTRPSYVILIDWESLGPEGTRNACALAGAFVDGLDPDDLVAIVAVPGLLGRVVPTIDRPVASASLRSVVESGNAVTGWAGATLRGPARQDLALLSLSVPDALAIADGDIRLLQKIESNYGIGGDEKWRVTHAAMRVAERSRVGAPLVLGTTVLLERPRTDSGRLVVVWLTALGNTGPAAQFERLRQAASTTHAAVSVVRVPNGLVADALDDCRRLASETGGAVMTADGGIDAAAKSLLAVTLGPEPRRPDPAGVSELTSVRRAAERPAAGSAYESLVGQYRTGDADRAVRALISWAPARLASEIRPLSSSSELEAAVALHAEAGVGLVSQFDTHFGISRRALDALKSRHRGATLEGLWLRAMAAGSALDYPMAIDREQQAGFERVKPSAERLALATDLFRAALATDTSATRTRLRLGRVLGLQNQASDAVSHLERARAEAEDSRFSYLASLFLGEVLEGAGQRAAAVEAYRAAIRLCPYALSAPLALAHVLENAGQSAEAGEVLQSGLAASSRGAAPDPWFEFLSRPTTMFGRELTALRTTVRQ